MFPDNLKRPRAAAGFTQASFAERVGVPLRSVQNWEQGHRKPGLETMAALAIVLRVTVDELIAGVADPTGKQQPKPKKPRSRSRKEKKTHG